MHTCDLIGKLHIIQMMKSSMQVLSSHIIFKKEEYISNFPFISNYLKQQNKNKDKSDWKNYQRPQVTCQSEHGKLTMVSCGSDTRPDRFEGIKDVFGKGSIIIRYTSGYTSGRNYMRVTWIRKTNA